MKLIILSIAFLPNIAIAQFQHVGKNSVINSEIQIKLLDTLLDLDSLQYTYVKLITDEYRKIRDSIKNKSYALSGKELWEINMYYDRKLEYILNESQYLKYRYYQYRTYIIE